jgi:hypothetical protein
MGFFEENPTLTLPKVEGILRKLHPLRGGNSRSYSLHFGEGIATLTPSPSGRVGVGFF